MKKSITWLTALSGVALLLAGCTPEVSVTTSSSEPSAPAASATASPSPAVVQLDDVTAADRYLDLVCPNNIAIRELADAFAAGEDEMLNGGDPDATAVRAVAARRLELNRQTLTLLDDPSVFWPDAVGDQLEHVRSSYLSELPTLDAMANAATFRDAFYTTFSEASPEQKAAGQQIRYTLGIDPDTVASCVGHETGIERLAAEYADRKAVLG
ncbi:hypothetical protein EDF35_3068 [Rathayibacter sp. PhB151]|uniref:hypothetical protein n=1 Tax=Rathayibacter sp. PhB151 TaxID=2485189 RepID=UPI00106303BB|nr:hypothetical protein [Rathayibacter sp. PhB151]TDX77552.1 hypothetical protein EDF35_3068 [Rathayibacter sp. PhB151]